MYWHYDKALMSWRAHYDQAHYDQAHYDQAHYDQALMSRQAHYGSG